MKDATEVELETDDVYMNPSFKEFTRQVVINSRGGEDATFEYDPVSLPPTPPHTPHHHPTLPPHTTTPHHHPTLPPHTTTPYYHVPHTTTPHYHPILPHTPHYHPTLPPHTTTPHHPPTLPHLYIEYHHTSSKHTHLPIDYMHVHMC